MEHELLHPPIEQLRDIELILARTRNLVNPPELLHFLPGLAEHAEDFALERELVDAPGHRVRAVQHLIRRRRDADRPWRTRRRERVWTRRAADHDVHILREWNVDREHAQKFSVRVEHLNAAIRPVRYVDIALRVIRDRVQDVELAGVPAAIAPRFHPSTVLVDLHDARVVVAVGDEDVAGLIPGDVRRTIERAPAGTRRAFAATCGRRSGLLDRLGAPTEHHQHFPRWAQLDDHVRALVRHPEIAVFVDTDGVRERESVEILPDLANERAIGTELEQLRRRLAVNQ